MSLVAFDLNGTLLDPGDQRETLHHAVRLAMAHTLASDPRPFAELIEAAGGSVPESMAPFPDVVEGLDRLRDAGHELIVITNSARDTGTLHLDRAGLLDRFERVVGVDEVGAYKPDRRVYAYALDQVGAEASDSWFVAAHDWDIVGAHAAGMRTLFVDRGGPAPSTVVPEGSVAALTDVRL